MNYKLLNSSEFKSWLNIRSREKVPFIKEEIIKLRYIFEIINFVEIKDKLKKIRSFFVGDKLYEVRGTKINKKEEVFISIIKFDDEWFIIEIKNNILFTTKILCDQFEELVEVLNNIDYILEDIKIRTFNEVISRGLLVTYDIRLTPATPNAYINNEISDTNT